VTKVEWKEKTHLQNKMRKEVTGQLYRSEVDLTDDERKELTNRVIELAREHYQ
jgi:type I restriction enzyme R subunit